MPHKIEISDKTYDKLKEFCALNELKVGPYADKLIFDGLMIEMYGDVPFTNYRKKIMKEFPVEKFEQKYMAQPEPLTKKEVEKIKEIVPSPIPEETVKMKEELENEILKQVGVPSKVVNKINKIRLK